MKYKRLSALLAAALLMGSLTACGGTSQADPVDTPTTVITTTTTTAKPIYVVTATSLNMRKGPGGEHEIIGSLYNGDVVEVLEIADGWCRILYEEQEAYVSADYLSEQAPTTQEVTATTTTIITTTTTTKKH